MRILRDEIQVLDGREHWRRQRQDFKSSGQMKDAATHLKPITDLIDLIWSRFARLEAAFNFR